ncbi:ATP-binding protein [Nocardiopsis mangrovi]|uniref:ATP-binding protein n=1 Tax=Nocardiopsis mangrovi TaxID=1179818 RepID=A0ABV9DT33_9ACTN
MIESGIGDAGIGTSHRWIASGAEAAVAGFRVTYTPATQPVDALIEAAGVKRLCKAIARCGRVDLLRIDEPGYMEPDRRGAEPPFQALTEREERTGTARPSPPTSPVRRTTTFTGPRPCAAIVDRLTPRRHHHRDRHRLPLPARAKARSGQAAAV